MNSIERMQACLGGSELDRPPVALWRHFPVDDQVPERLAAATAAFQRAYGFDFVKVTPASSFCLRDWGVQDQWLGATEGTRDYVQRVVHQPGDWARLRTLDPAGGFLGQQLACLRLLGEDLGSQVPIIQTIFSPLAQAKNLSGERKLLFHMRSQPEAVHEGLRIITESTRRFITAAAATGIAGIFYAVQHAQYGLLSEPEYEEFGRQYDLAALEPAADMWLNVLHLHGENIMFDRFLDYPVQVLNWHDQETPPDLAAAKQRFPGVVCGGLGRQDGMVLGTPETITIQARDALEATGAERFILGTGCVTPITAPHGNILAARMSVEG